MIATREGRPSAAGPLPRARPRRSLAGVLVIAATMGVLLGRFVMAGGGSAPAGAPAGRSSADAVAALQARLQANPNDTDALTRLGVAYLGRARDTGDPSYYAKAGQAVEASLALDARSPATMTAAGLVALGRHEFSVALDWGRQAHGAQPDAADPLGVMVDAFVELGRYDEALAAAQDMVDRRPSLSALARVSYLRELHGDVPGAIAAMTQAVAAGAGAAADVAAVEVLLGDLYLGAGDVAAARRAYERALDRMDGAGGLAAAEAGLARADAAAGDLDGAIARLEPAVRRLPISSSVALLGDLYLARGRAGEAQAQYDLVRQIEKLNQAGGVAVDLELARFEADHGSPGAVGLAEAAFAARPTVYAADALGWALRQSGRPADALPHARAAVRLGTADALLWYHLAAVEADLGLVAEARAHLAAAFALNPNLTVRDLPAATALAGRLGISR